MSPQKLFIESMRHYLPQNPLCQRMGSTHPLKEVVEALFYHRFTVMGVSWKRFPSITLMTNEPVMDSSHRDRITFSSLPDAVTSNERKFHQLSSLVDNFNQKFGTDLEVHRGEISYRERAPHPKRQDWYLTLCDQGGPWAAKIPREYDDPEIRKEFQGRSRQELVAFGEWLMDNLPTQ